MPPEQVPGELYVRRVEPSKQSADGGVLHVTLAQGSPLQTPPLHPNEHVVSVGV